MNSQPAKAEHHFACFFERNGTLQRVVVAAASHEQAERDVARSKGFKAQDVHARYIKTVFVEQKGR